MKGEIVLTSTGAEIRLDNGNKIRLSVTGDNSVKVVVIEDGMITGIAIEPESNNSFTIKAGTERRMKP